jgi:type II secretory pathway pseudopilin PulG
MVVIAILALLIAILLPALGKARRSAKRTACAAQLKDVGVAFQVYINGNRDRLPHISILPSVSPLPLTTKKGFSIADVLKDEISDTRAFRCPNDESGGKREPPNDGVSYFDSEGSSYEFRVQLNGMQMKEVAERFSRFRDTAIADNMIWLLRDYANFHGKAGEPGARRYLYIDGHVGDYEN